MTSLLNFAKAQISSAWLNTLGTRGEFKHLREKTAFVVQNSVPPHVCKALVERIDKISEVENGRIWRDAIGSDTRILCFEQDIEDLLENFQIERRIKAIDAYLGKKTRAWFLMANRVLPKANNLGSGGGLHRDSPFSHQVKCIWYLNDVTADNGPFQYIEGTHSRLISQRKKYPLGQSRFVHVDAEVTEVHAAAGSLLVCDTKCIHGGKPIIGGARYAVTLYTFAKVDGIKEIFTKSGLDSENAIQFTWQ